MRILIAGANGFIGKNFIELYGKKYDAVTAPFSALCNYKDMSALFDGAKFDAVLLLPPTHDTFMLSSSRAENLTAFNCVRLAAIRSGVKKLITVDDCADLDLGYVHANSTESEFGKRVPEGYGIGGYIMHSLASKDKISTVLRCFGTFGKYSDAESNRITEILSHAVTGSKNITLAGDKKVSVLYAEDACKIIDKFLTGDYPKGIYNVASPTTATLGEFAKKAKSFARQNGRDVTVNIGENDEFELTANVNKLTATVGQMRFTALSTAISRTLEYYASHKRSLRKGANE